MQHTRMCERRWREILGHVRAGPPGTATEAGCESGSGMSCNHSWDQTRAVNGGSGEVTDKCDEGRRRGSPGRFYQGSTDAAATCAWLFWGMVGVTWLFNWRATVSSAAA